MDLLESATRKWLEHENPLPKTKQFGDLIETEVSSEPVEQPETYSWVLQARRLNIPVMTDALWDTPYVFLQEVNTVIDAEREFERIHAFNLLQIAKQAANENSEQSA